MSILLDPASLRNRVSPFRSTFWFSAYVVTVIIGGAALGAILIRNGLAKETGFWHDLILEHGPARILRRIQTLCAIVLAPWMLKKIGWEGFRDLGWNSAQSREDRKKDFFRWFAIGCFAMCSIFLLSLFTGVRNLNSFSFWIFLSSMVSGFLLTGIGVGFLEETLTRGVLYRSLSRVWTPWLSALITSLIFAWAHFMKANPDSFQDGILAVVSSSLFADFANEVVPLKFVNMFAFGIVLCRLVQSRGDIWAAVGLHAAAVGCIKVFSKMTDFERTAPYQSWIGGHSSKFDDGWLLTFVLFLLLCVIEWKHRNPAATSSRVHF